MPDVDKWNLIGNSILSISIIYLYLSIFLKIFVHSYEICMYDEIMRPCQKKIPLHTVDVKCKFLNFQYTFTFFKEINRVIIELCIKDKF